MPGTYYPEPSPLQINIHGTGRCSTCYQRRKGNTNPVTHPSIYKSDLMARLASAMVAQDLWEWANTLWFESRLWEGSHPQCYLGGREPEIRYPRNLKKKQILPFCQNNMTIKWLLVAFFYAHWSMPCFTIIRNASFCCRWEQIQRPTARQHTKSEKPG